MDAGRRVRAGQAGNLWVAHQVSLANAYYFLHQGGAFLDFKIFEARFHLLHTAAFWQTGPGYYGSWGLFNYPAFAGVVASWFYLLGEPWSLRALLLLGAAGAVAGAVLLTRACVRRGLRPGAAALYVALAALLSGPLLFLFRSANFEIVSWLLTLVAVVALWNRRWMTAAVVLGLATSFKLIPGTLLLVLLSEKRYREFGTGVLVAVLATVASLWYLGPTVHEAQAGLNAGMTMFRDLEVLYFHPWSAQFDHSMFSMLKRFLPLGKHNAHRELKEYEAVVAVVSVVLYWVRVRLLPRANQIAVLTLCSVLLPPVSFEYTLVHLLLGWGVLSLVCVSAARRDRVLPGSVAAMALYAALNVDLYHLLRRWSVRYDDYVSYEGAVKMVLLLVLMVVVLRYPWPDTNNAAPHAA